MHADNMLDYIHNIFMVKQRVDEIVGDANGLSPLDVHMLTFVKMQSVDPTATDIERKHRIKKNTISVHVESLVQNGYLLRQYNADDRRKVILSLTEKGEEIARQCFEKCEEMSRKLRQGLSDEDVDAMYRYFAVVNDNALAILTDGKSKRRSL